MLSAQVIELCDQLRWLCEQALQRRLSRIQYVLIERLLPRVI